MSANGAAFCCDPFGKTTNSGAFNSLSTGNLTSCRGCINELEVTNLTVNNQIIFQNGGCPLLTANLPLENIPLGGPCSVELIPGDCWGQYFAWDTANGRWSIASQVAGIDAGPLGVTNVYLGCDSMNPGVTGLNNTTVGNLAGFNITSGNNNTSVGQSAMVNANLYLNPSHDCVAMGVNALRDGGQFDVAIGHNILLANQSLFGSNVAIGSNVMNTFAGAAGGFNYAIGNNIMPNITGSRGNVIAVGTNVMSGNPVNGATEIVAMGHNTLQNFIGNPLVDSHIVTIGRSALQTITDGDSHTVVGVQAMQNTTTAGSGNCAFGYLCANNDQSSGSVSMGALAFRGGASLAAGSQLVIGTRAFTGTSGTQVTGQANLVIGNNALQYSTGAGNFNTVIGNDACSGIVGQPSTATRCTIVGYGACSSLSTGTQNAFFGDVSGAGVATGNFNTFVGSVSVATADISRTTMLGANTNSNFDQCIILGNGAVSSAANQLVLGSGVAPITGAAIPGVIAGGGQALPVTPTGWMQIRLTDTFLGGPTIVWVPYFT